MWEWRVKTWSDISTLVKAIASTFIAVVAALAILWGWGGLLHTDVEAQSHLDDFEAYQQQRYQADKYERIDQVEMQIDEIDFQLLSDILSQAERHYLETLRADLVNKVICIQRDEC